MKKILLIIALAFCIFQMVVLAEDIDIGTAAIGRTYTTDWQTTKIVVANPANASGKITSVEIYASDTMLSCKVATFYLVSGTTFSTRDWEEVGEVLEGAKRTFEVDIDVQEGDYIGIKFSGGALYSSNSGSGRWTLFGDEIPCTESVFSFTDNKTISLFGTGETVAVGIKWNGVTITKWNGITITIPLNTQ